MTRTETIKNTVNLLMPPGVVEVRAMPEDRTFSGYYKDREKLIADIMLRDDLTWYFCLNEINEACYSRAQSEKIITSRKLKTTSDSDITRLRWILIDCDPARPSGVSSSEEEKKRSLQVITKVHNYLQGCGFPSPVVCDSGNGYHLLYRVDLPAEQAKTVKIFLQALDLLFSDEAAAIDTAVYNPARITKLYGTIARKGANTEERPHRASKILRIPDEIKVVSLNLIQDVIETIPKEEPIQPPSNPNESRFDLLQFLSEHNIRYREGKCFGNARKFIPDACIFDPSHKAPDAAFFLFGSGSIGYKCLHQSCAGKGWKAVREYLDPGCYDQKPLINHSPSNRAETASTSREEKQININSILGYFHPLEDFEEQEATWLVNGWLPEGQITILASDGGVGKTTLWCNIAAAISSGKKCILDEPEVSRDPQKVLFLTTEDSVRKKLRKKLRLAGANLNNISCPDFAADKEGLLRDLKFGSKEMEAVIRQFRPALCVFDPLQGFLPPNLNMGSRNAMRDVLGPLIALGEDIGTTFLIICHSNKRKGAYGRDRISDSADIWDIGRSVLMSGFTDEKNIRYLSHEKCNYTEMQQTILYSIDSDGKIIFEGKTWKRDREYQEEKVRTKATFNKDEAKDWIMETLVVQGGKMKMSELDDLAQSEGIKFDTLKRAKSELAKEDKKIKRYPTGFGSEKHWFIELLN